MKGRCLSRESASISRYFANCFRFGTGQDFLKSQVVSKRVPFQRVRKSESEIIKGQGGHR